MFRPPIRAPRRLSVACLAWVAVAFAGLSGGATEAHAHAAFLESDPPPGKRLESSPAEIKLEFTEPLDRSLSGAKLVAAGSGRSVRADVARGANQKQLVLRPVGRLPMAAYRVEWHAVSTEDGHPLEGSFGFGVRTAAAGGSQEVEQSPLARTGWIRIAARALFYVALFFFAGGVLTTALLRRTDPAASWLTSASANDALAEAGVDGEARRARAWSLTLDAGWLAVGMGTAVAIIEAADASRGLTVAGLRDFLLSNPAGQARVATVVALVVALMVVDRARAFAAVAIATAFGAIALSGHANSGEPRFPALFTDWLHLLAGTVWIGGLAQIAVAWLPVVTKRLPGLSRAVMRDVLARFGTIALPAFLLLASTGLINALIQLGHVKALWETRYGAVLLTKIALVSLIALLSYWHAMRLRPRILAANPHPPERLERRHWRLLATEPLVAAVVLLAAAALVAFPLPPGQIADADEAESQSPSAGASACDPCALPKPADQQLGVADHAGSSIVAAWIERAGGGLRGQIKVFGLNMTPVAADVTIPGATTTGCGTGCWRVRFERAPSLIEVRLPEKGRTHTARLPARWQPGESGRARQLLVRAQNTMRGLRGLRERETITSGPGSFVETRYRLNAPDRFAYVIKGAAASVTIGTKQWFRSPDGTWRLERYGGGGPPFRTRSWFRWTNYARTVRFLSERSVGGERIATIALLDHATPIWYRLDIELATMRVVRLRMIADGHFMNQHYSAFDEPQAIEPPGSGG